jgi:hypothetical protein
MKPESKKLLEDFIERAEHIRNFSYFEGKENIAGFDVKEVNGEQQIDFYQPSVEQRDAILMHLRLFLQDKDRISIRKLANLVNDPDISIKWKEEVKEIREGLNIRLDELVSDGQKGKLNNRDILNMFLFGKIAHDNPNDESNKLYQKWITNDTEYEILHNVFHVVLIHLLTAILNISSASKEELQRHYKSIP